ncbi:unnamed protein product [Linum trigynum]|uniref:DUF4283 domain-containing protein n=1 Tax=Linum trigynum TaxID=586398 RepID=A0AAV2G4X4_9ROSI
MVHVTDDQLVQFSLEEVQSTEFRSSRMPLGRLFTDSPINPIEVREAVNYHCQEKNQIKVLIAKHGLLEFVLPTKESKNWVLKRTPWIIKDNILHLRPWSHNVTKRTFEELAIAAFRV